jgi:hypothetical protein
MNDPFETIAAQRTGDLARRIRTEGKIARKLVAELLARRFSVSVNDGEEWTVNRSTDKAEIVGALFSTDEDIIRGFRPDGSTIGMAYLVYGNDGYDVINDYTANGEMEEIMEEVINPYCDKLEEGR